MKRGCGEASASEQPVVRNLPALIFAIPIRSLRTKQSQTKNETLQAQRAGISSSIFRRCELLHSCARRRARKTSPDSRVERFKMLAFIVIAATLPSIVCLLSSAWLAYKERPQWWWFALLSLVTGSG